MIVKRLTAGRAFSTNNGPYTLSNLVFGALKGSFNAAEQVKEFL